MQTLHLTRTHILLFLPDPGATIMLNAFLTLNGFAVTTTYLLREFTEAAALGTYSAIITSAALAVRIRDVSALPIIDISAFLLSTGSDSGRQDSKSLDGVALAERLAMAVASIRAETAWQAGDVSGSTTGVRSGKNDMFPSK